MNINGAGKKRILTIEELEEWRDTTYESARIYKDKTKRQHDKRIKGKNLISGMKVLLFNSRLKLFPGKLRSRWNGSYEIVKVFPHGAVEIKHPLTQQQFKVNG